MASSSIHVREHACWRHDCTKFHCVYLPLCPLRDIWTDIENLPLGSTSYHPSTELFSLHLRLGVSARVHLWPTWASCLHSRDDEAVAEHLWISSCPTSKQGRWLPDSDNGMVTPFTWKWDYSQGCRNSLPFNIPSDSQNILIAYWETIGKFPYVWYFLDNATKEKIAPQVLPACALLLISLAYYRLKDDEGLLWVCAVQEGDCIQLSLIFSILN